MESFLQSCYQYFLWQIHFLTFFFSLYSFTHMCIYCLGHFSPPHPDQALMKARFLAHRWLPSWCAQMWSRKQVVWMCFQGPTNRPYLTLITSLKALPSNNHTGDQGFETGILGGYIQPIVRGICGCSDVVNKACEEILSLNEQRLGAGEEGGCEGEFETDELILLDPFEVSTNEFRIKAAHLCDLLQLAVLILEKEKKVFEFKQEWSSGK